MAVSDVLFGYLSWYRLYDAVSPNTLTCIVDLLRHVGYAILAFGIYIRLRLTR